MSELTATPGQTIGPFFHYALPYEHDRELVPREHAEAVRLHGYVYDGAGTGIPDALLEIRQADSSGAVPSVEGSLSRDGTTFTGWGRAGTDEDGHYWFTTILPTPTRRGAAPFVAVTVFARGLLNRLFTRAYLPGDQSAYDADPLLGILDQRERTTLLARQDGEQSYRFDIHLQGDDQTVFLSFPRHRS